MTESKLQTELTLGEDQTSFQAWVLAKKAAVFIGVLIFIELIYFLLTASSAIEITVISIVAFSFLINIPVFRHFYNTLD
jgi:hypothetical protein